MVRDVHVMKFAIINVLCSVKHIQTGEKVQI